MSESLPPKNMVAFFIFRRRISELARPIELKLCQMEINAVLKRSNNLGAPAKMWESKNTKRGD